MDLLERWLQGDRSVNLFEVPAEPAEHAQDVSDAVREMSSSFLDTLYEAIERGDRDNVVKILGTLDYKTIRPRVLYMFGGRVLEKAVNSFFAREMVEAVLETFDSFQFDGDETLFFMHILHESDLSIETLQKIVDVSIDLEPYAYFTQFASLNIETTAPWFFSRLVGAFRNNIPIETYQQMLEFLKVSENSNLNLLRCVKNVLKDRMPFADVPVWVQKRKTLEDHNALVQEVKARYGSSLKEPVSVIVEERDIDKAKTVRSSRTPRSRSPTSSRNKKQERESMFEGVTSRKTTQDIAEQLYQNLTLSGIYPGRKNQEKELKEYIRTILNTSDPATRQLLSESLSNVNTRANLDKTDTFVFNVCGPVNVDLVEDLSGSHLCALTGGHRMLTCQCFERSPLRAGYSYEALTGFYDDDDDADNPDHPMNYADWFMLKSCHNCCKRIRSRAHAIRIPQIFGGWLGCYCSVSCLIEHLPDEQAGDMAFRRLLEHVVAQLNHYKIWDRLPENMPSEDDINADASDRETRKKQEEDRQRLRAIKKTVTFDETAANDPDVPTARISSLPEIKRDEPPVDFEAVWSEETFLYDVMDEPL